MGAGASIDDVDDLEKVFKIQKEDGTITADQATQLQSKYDNLPEKKKKNEFLVIGMMNKEYDSMGIGGGGDGGAAAAAKEETKPVVEEKKPFPSPPAGFTTKAAPEGTGIKVCAMTELPAALEEAANAGLTPLVIDRSSQHAVDTFWTYSASILDAKKMALDVTVRKEPMKDVMDKQRKILCQAIMHGKTLIFACQTSCPDFKATFNDISCCDPENANLTKNGEYIGLDAKADFEGKPFKSSTAENKAFIPLDLFDNGGRPYTEKENVKKCEALFRQEEADQNSGIAKIVDTFNIIVSTHFNYEDLDDFLFADTYGLPPGKFFPIWIQHEDGTAAME